MQVGTRSRLLKAAAGAAAVTAATVGAGVVVERRVVRTRRRGSKGAARFTSLRGDVREVRTDDDLCLHVEVDEVAPYAGTRKQATDEPTLVFVHGYALNLHCWYFQREAMRGKYRMVFYDQRSHGRSDRSDRAHATIDQLGLDLAAVIEQVVPAGPVVLVGHSMGGMSILALAEARPDLFASRVVGVALLATTAGGLRPHRIVGRLVPDRVGQFLAPRVVTALAAAPELVDSARRGSNLGFLAADLFAFGRDAPAEEVEFVEQMIAATPMSVLAEFFPSFSALDKFVVLERVNAIPTLVLCGTADKLTSIGHSRKMAQRMPEATLVESAGSGHMVIIEDRARVNDELDRLVERARRHARAAS
jgi:pimeloyl-ACP methyl ester carboxylesterase